MDQHVDLFTLSGSGVSDTRHLLPIGRSVRPPADAGTAHPPLHDVLRAATRGVHERLHRHAGFAAIQDASISLEDYRKLVARLYGFYLPFEAAACLEPDRSVWLADDLEALGQGGPLDAVPKCPHLPWLDTAHSRLGALYVAEGSALGGRGLARSLDRLLGIDSTSGRCFFIGRGPGTGEAWRAYLARLSAAPSSPSARADIVHGTTETFAAFERWMNGWSTSTHG